MGARRLCMYGSVRLLRSLFATGIGDCAQAMRACAEASSTRVLHAPLAPDECVAAWRMIRKQAR
eukprot:1396708-Pleurochrysis_carterae.AAC.1